MIICDHISLTQLISSLGDLGSFIAALVAASTLSQLKKQNSSAYEADLGLASSVDFLKFRNGYEIETSDAHYETDWIEPLYLRIFNCGFGSAKSIEVKFEYDYHKSEEFLNSIIESMGIQEFFKLEKSPIAYTFKRNDSKVEDLYLKGEKFQWNINFILPNKGLEEASNVPIPREIGFFLFCASYIYKYSNTDPYFLLAQRNFKPLSFKVHIDYKSVTTTSKSHSYEVTVYFFSDTEGPKVKMISQLL